MYDLFKSLIKIPHITQCVFYSTYCLTCFSNIKLISKSFNFLLLILHTHSYWLLSVIANMHPFETAVLIHFSYIWLFATLCTIAHQAPLSMGLSRQEYWSGLSFPSPQWLQNWWKLLAIPSCPTLCDPVDNSPLSMELSRQEYWSGQSFPSPGDLADPGIKPKSLTLWADSLPSKLQRQILKSFKGGYKRIFAFGIFFPQFLPKSQISFSSSP